MKTKEGTVLGPLEIVNEYGMKYTFKNNLKKGEHIWIYYDGQGSVVGVEPKNKVPRNIHILDKKE